MGAKETAYESKRHAYDNDEDEELEDHVENRASEQEGVHDGTLEKVPKETQNSPNASPDKMQRIIREID